MSDLMMWWGIGVVGWLIGYCWGYTRGFVKGRRRALADMLDRRDHLLKIVKERQQR